MPFVRMPRVVFAVGAATLLGSLAAAAFAASYQLLDGSVVDPIQSIPPPGGPHPYFGPGLQPSVNLFRRDLTNANLFNASLSNAGLANANRSGALNLDTTFGFADYDASTNFTGTGFDPIAKGWILVPEPSSLALLGLGGLPLAPVAAARVRLRRGHRQASAARH